MPQAGPQRRVEFGSLAERRETWERSTCAQYLVDRDGLLRDVNPALARLLGWSSPEAARGSSLREWFVVGDDRGREDATRVLHREGGRPLWERVACLVGENARGGQARRVWCRISEVAVDAGPAEEVLFLGALVPIENEIALREAAREREALYLSLQDAIAEAIVVVDGAGEVVVLNEGGERLFGCRLSEVVGVHLSSLLPRVDRCDGGARKRLDDGWFRSTGLRRELELHLVRGERRRALVTVAAVRVPGTRKDEQYLLSFADRTEVEEARRSQREIEQRELLLSGLTHDLRNLLAAVYSGTELLALVSDEEERRAHADQVRRGARLAVDLLNELLGVSQRGIGPRSAALPVDEQIASVKAILEAVAAPFELRLELDAGALEQPADGAIESILVNLVMNARQAALDAARADAWIRVRTERVSEGSGGAPRLRIVVADNGPGLPDEIRERAEQPYITGRSGSGGTGLGLTRVAQLVAELGGSLEIGSEPDRGTEVTMDLPAR